MKKFKAILIVLMPIIVAVILCVLIALARIKIADSLGLPWWSIFFMGK
jgi:hypothetical protein